MSKLKEEIKLRKRFNELVKSDIDGNFKEQYGWTIGMSGKKGLEGFNEWLENEVRL